MPTINPGTLYLVAAAGLICGAGFFAAKKAFPHLQAKQFALIVMIAVLMVDLIWMLLSFTTKRAGNAPGQGTTEQPLLPPNPD